MYTHTPLLTFTAPPPPLRTHTSLDNPPFPSPPLLSSSLVPSSSSLLYRTRDNGDSRDEGAKTLGIVKPRKPGQAAFNIFSMWGIWLLFLACALRYVRGPNCIKQVNVGFSISFSLSLSLAPSLPPQTSPFCSCDAQVLTGDEAETNMKWAALSRNCAFVYPASGGSDSDACVMCNPLPVAAPVVVPIPPVAGWFTPPNAGACLNALPAHDPRTWLELQSKSCADGTTRCGHVNNPDKFEFTGSMDT
jgi:hypothetical protein